MWVWGRKTWIIYLQGIGTAAVTPTTATTATMATTTTTTVMAAAVDCPGASSLLVVVTPMVQMVPPPFVGQCTIDFGYLCQDVTVRLILRGLLLQWKKSNQPSECEPASYSWNFNARFSRAHAGSIHSVFQLRYSHRNISTWLYTTDVLTTYSASDND